MWKIEQNWGKIANYPPPDAQDKSAPLAVDLLFLFTGSKHWNEISPDIKNCRSLRSFFKLRKYKPQKALMSLCYTLVYSHLQYAIICWGKFS